MIIEPQNLTSAARAALIASDYRAGSPLAHSASLRVAAELAMYGLIDAEANLTHDGAIVRARHIDACLGQFHG